MCLPSLVFVSLQKQQHQVRGFVGLMSLVYKDIRLDCGDIGLPSKHGSCELCRVINCWWESPTQLPRFLPESSGGTIDVTIHLYSPHCPDLSQPRNNCHFISSQGFLDSCRRWLSRREGTRVHEMLDELQFVHRDYFKSSLLLRLTTDTVRLHLGDRTCVLLAFFSCARLSWRVRVARWVTPLSLSVCEEDSDFQVTIQKRERPSVFVHGKDSGCQGLSSNVRCNALGPVHDLISPTGIQSKIRPNFITFFFFLNFSYFRTV